MPKAKCPQCATVVSYAAGYDPICPSCGFRGEAPPTPMPPVRPAAWTAVPASAAPGGPQLVYATPPAYGAPPGYAAPAYAYARPQNGMATAGLVLGILALVLFWIPMVGFILSLLAAGLGGAGLAAAERDPQLAHTRGAALTGLVLGVVALLLGLFIWGEVFGWDEGPFWWD